MDKRNHGVTKFYIVKRLAPKQFLSHPRKRVHIITDIMSLEISETKKGLISLLKFSYVSICLIFLEILVLMQRNISKMVKVKNDCCQGRLRSDQLWSW